MPAKVENIKTTRAGTKRFQEPKGLAGVFCRLSSMTIRSFFEDTLARHPNRVMFTFRQGGRVVRRSYAEAGARVRRISQLAVRRLGLAPRGVPVAIMLENGPTWIELYLGHCSVAIPVVPLDPKLRQSEISFILGNAGAQVIYTDTHHMPTLLEVAPSLPAVRAFVLVDGKNRDTPAEIDGRPCLDLETLIEEADASGPDAVYDAIRPEEDDIASFIYTSGTTGHPKGAILSHGNFCADARAAWDMFKMVDTSDDFFVVLPLFHAFSFSTNFICPIMIGAGIQFATSLRSIGDDMKAFKPSLIMAVPLLVEKMHDKIEDGIRKNPVGRFLAKIGLRKLLVPRIKANFGGRLKLFIVGGAPCSAKLLNDMRAMNMPIIEGYGLTEASPIVSIRPFNDEHVGTIGIPLGNIEVKLAEKDANGVGELLVRGPIVMKGYLNNPEATAETLDPDGWLHTGDLASQDADGFLTIRGRKKALIVNREGKNIYPEEVEICIGHDKHVLDVVVVGYSEGGEVGERVGAIVVPDMDVFTRENGRKEPSWEKIEAAMHRIVAEQCKNLADYKAPRKVAVYKDPLVRTSAGKIRRFAYRHALDS